jgi:hypothetical protein
MAESLVSKEVRPDRPSPFAQAFDQSPARRQLPFVVSCGRRITRIAARFEGSVDLGLRPFSHGEIMAPLGEYP